MELDTILKIEPNSLEVKIETKNKIIRKYCTLENKVKVINYSNKVFIEKIERRVKKTIYYDEYKKNAGIYSEKNIIGIEKDYLAYHFNSKDSENEVLIKFGLKREIVDEIIIKLKK